MPYQAIVKIKTNVNPSLASDKQTSALYQRGDIVVVQEAGWPWGSDELRHFLVVQFPDNWSAEQCQCLCHNPIVEGRRFNPQTDDDDIAQESICRRRFALDIDRLIDRRYRNETDLEGAELDAVIVMAHERLNDPLDDFQPVQHIACQDDDIADKKGLPELDALAVKLARRLATDGFKSVARSDGNDIPQVKRKALALSQ